MSRQFLENLATEVEAIIQEQVRDELNLLEHTTIFSRGGLATAVLQELNFVKKDGSIAFEAWNVLPEDAKLRIIDDIDYFIENALEQIWLNAKKEQQELKKLKGPAKIDLWPKSGYTRGTTPYIRVISVVPEGSNIEVEAPYRSTGVELLTSFRSIRDIYDEPVKKIFDSVEREIALYKEEMKNLDPDLLATEERNFLSNKVVQSGNPLLGSNKGRASVALSHIEGTAVSEIKNSRADTKVRQLLGQYKKQTGIGATKKLIRETGLDVFLEYKSTIEVTSMLVKVGGTKENLSQSGLKEGPSGKKRKNTIDRLKTKLQGDLEDLEGSDSRSEIEKKKIVKAFNDAVKKGLVKNTINTNPELSTHQMKRQIKGSVKRSSTRAKYKGRGSRKFSSTEVKLQNSSINLVSLLPVINSKLTEQVIKNMKFPALQNRTGRFAGSVRAVDVNVTKQGYPSIGYTYRKNPYQIFEQGAGKPPWASDDRDPRTLIDRSIREIARELIVGRFYTRRV